VTAPQPLGRPGQIFAVGLFTVLGAMTAALEILLVPLYIGSVIFPITLVIVLVCNSYLPRAVRMFTDSTGLALLPVAAWVVVLIYFGLVPNPMGDVLLPGYGQGQYVGEGLLVIGLLVGVASAALHRPSPHRPSPHRPSPNRPSPHRPGPQPSRPNPIK
jgi:hypothetical protein